MKASAASAASAGDVCITGRSKEDGDREIFRHQRAQCGDERRTRSKRQWFGDDPGNRRCRADRH